MPSGLYFDMSISLNLTTKIVDVLNLLKFISLINDDYTSLADYRCDYIVDK